MSDLRIDCEGTWFYRGREMTRRDIINLFYRHLQYCEPGGCAIELRGERYPVVVDDTAYVIRAVGKGKNGERLRLELSDDSSEELAPATLRIGKNNVPYCRVKGGAFDARFSRAAYYELAGYIGYDAGSGGFYIEQEGRRYPVPFERDE